MGRTEMIKWCKANNVDFANRLPKDSALPKGWLWVTAAETNVLIGVARRKGVNFELIEPSDLGQGTK